VSFCQGQSGTGFGVHPPYFRHLQIFFGNLGKAGCATTPTARIVTLSRVARAGAVSILTGKTSAF
jgi:hypothetical protein